MTEVLRPVAAVGPAPARTAVPVGPVLAVLAVLAAAACLVPARLDGAAAFPVDAVSVGSLLAAGALGLVVAHRSRRTGLVLLPGSLLGYLALGGLAVAADRAGAAGAGAAVAVWAASWALPLAAVQVRALATLSRRWAAAVAGLALLAWTGAVVVGPVPDPFAGYLPALGADPVVPVPVDLLATGWLVSLVAVPVALAVAARRGAGTGVPAVAAAGPPLAVVVCLGLAVLRDPGRVDPSAGSPAFVVATSAVVLAAVAVLGAAPDGSRRTADRAAAALLAGAVAVGALLVGTLVADLVAPSGPTAVALAVGALAVGAVLAVRALAPRLVRAVGGAAPRPPLLAPPTPSAAAGVGTASEAGGGTSEAPSADAVPGTPPAAGLTVLTRRENEVMALVAAGSTNAEVAERLVLSTRTVESHLRSVFAKLDLPAEAGGHRRVRAVARWREGA